MVSLTPREIEVLLLVAKGLSNKEIAETLCISVKTARNHVTNILPKLDLRSRGELSNYAWRRGLVRPNQDTGKS